jgi:hypothetical protein
MGAFIKKLFLRLFINSQFLLNKTEVLFPALPGFQILMCFLTVKFIYPGFRLEASLASLTC